MKTAAQESFLSFSSGFEGVFRYPYLDIKGLVTIAIGDLIDPARYAFGLPFVRPDGSPASQQEIAAAWLAVKGISCWAEPGARAGYTDDMKCPWTGKRRCLAHLGARAAEQHTTIRLTTEGVTSVVLAKAAAFEEELETRFPTFDSWPCDAQLATMSMAWACGAHFNFPSLAAALNAHDFARAADTCHINDTYNKGVTPRNAANRVLYRNAACVMRMEEAAADRLFWPSELWPDVKTGKGLQKALSILGFSVGAIDGIVGARTNAGLEEFRISRGIDDDVARSTLLARLEQDVLAGVTAREAPTQPDVTVEAPPASGDASCDGEGNVG